MIKRKCRLIIYATKFTAHTLCTSFHDSKQKSDELVQDFYNRVSQDHKIKNPDQRFYFLK